MAENKVKTEQTFTIETIGSGVRAPFNRPVRKCFQQF
jgi:hypothetical protein